MTFTDDAKAVIALTTRLGDSKRPSLSPIMWSEFSGLLTTSGLRPSSIFESGLNVEDFPGIRVDLATRVKELMLDASAATVAADELSLKGIWSLTIVDDEYPATLSNRLAKNAPPVIFGVGERSLLTGDGIGIVGSRNVRVEGAEITEKIAAKAVELSRSVVSGGARGVDQLAMNSAHQAGGSVVGILADSLEARVRKPDILRALDAGSTCLVTQQTPSSGFSPGAAMGRNRLIYALSAITVVVAADEGSGGTWAGATEALKNSNGVVAVWRGEGEGPGNQALEQQGCWPIRTADDLCTVLASTSRGSVDLPAEPVQLGLLDIE